MTQSIRGEEYIWKDGLKQLLRHFTMHPYSVFSKSWRDCSPPVQTSTLLLLLMAMMGRRCRRLLGAAISRSWRSYSPPAPTLTLPLPVGMIGRLCRQLLGAAT